MKELIQTYGEGWADFGMPRREPLVYKSVRNAKFISNDQKSSPIYLARADGVMYSVDKKLIKTID